MSQKIVIETVDPCTPEVANVIARHLAMMQENTPPESVHALDLDGLRSPEVTFFALRLEGRVVGIGAVKDLGDGTGEVKSMHTVAEVRGNGIGDKLVEHAITHGRAAGMHALLLETGAFEAHAPARALYAKHGFVPSGSFADYGDDPHSAYMRRDLS